MYDVLSFDEFWDRFSKTGYFPDGAYVSPKGYPTDAKRKSRYKKYCLWVEKQNNKEIENQEKKKYSSVNRNSLKTDKKWAAVQKYVHARDNGKCRLVSLLTREEFHTLCNYSGGLHKVLDCAHIKSRGSHPELKYDPDNVVLLNRFSHSMLDSGRHPLTGRACYPEEREYWWMRIIQRR